MNSSLRCLAMLSFGALVAGLAHADEPVAQAPWQLAANGNAIGGNSAPDNGAVRRANPNSRQGTQSISPSMRGPNLGPTQPRPPTLENGGIGNGYPTRDRSPRPSGGSERRAD